MLLSAALLGIHSPDHWGFVQLNTLACVPGVSYRVIAQKFEWEQKKETFLFNLFCSRPNFLDKLERKRSLRWLEILGQLNYDKSLPPIGQQ